MKHVMLAAVLSLAACAPPANPPAAGASAAPGAPAAQVQTLAKPDPSQPAAVAVAPASGKPGAAPAAPAAAYGASTLIGRWGDNGDCNKDVIFRADGTFHSYTGGDGQWSLSGDRLTMSGQAGSFELRLRWQGVDRMQVINPDGSVGTSQRC